jgi:hypothetical protein
MLHGGTSRLVPSTVAVPPRTSEGVPGQQAHRQYDHPDHDPGADGLSRPTNRNGHGDERDRDGVVGDGVEPGWQEADKGHGDLRIGFCCFRLCSEWPTELDAASALIGRSPLLFSGMDAGGGSVMA